MSSDPHAAISVANLNNNAALAIQEGNFAAAHGLLSAALIATKKCLRMRKERADEDMDYNITSNISEVCWFHCGSSRDHFQESSFRSNNVVTRRDEDECYLFRSPLQVNVGSIERIGNLTSNAVMEPLTFTTVYNLALMHHLSGNASSHQKTLQRAIVLYRQADVLLSCHTPSSILFFKLTIANNTGHAYSNLRRPEEARHCFQELAKIIDMYNLTAAGLEPQKRRLEVNGGFLSNVMLR
jgi:tetratricopeptide (TPR) repeat protein